MADSESLTAPPDRPEPTPQELLETWLQGLRRFEDVVCDGEPEEMALLGVSFSNFVHRCENEYAALVAVPARAHQEEKEDENDEGVSRVDGVPGVGQGDLPRKPPTGEQ